MDLPGVRSSPGENKVPDVVAGVEQSSVNVASHVDYLPDSSANAMIASQATMTSAATAPAVIFVFSFSVYSRIFFRETCKNAPVDLREDIHSRRRIRKEIVRVVRAEKGVLHRDGDEDPMGRKIIEQWRRVFHFFTFRLAQCCSKPFHKLGSRTR
jgi:hypothetical protein